MLLPSKTFSFWRHSLKKNMCLFTWNGFRIGIYQLINSIQHRFWRVLRNTCHESNDLSCSKCNYFCIWCYQMQKGTDNSFIALPREKHLLASFSFLIPTLINRNNPLNLPFFKGDWCSFAVLWNAPGCFLLRAEKYLRQIDLIKAIKEYFGILEKQRNLTIIRLDFIDHR